MDMRLDYHVQYSRRNYLLIHGVKENETEDTDEVVIEIFEKEMQRKVSISDVVDLIDLEKDIPEVDFGLLSLNLPSTMSVMQFLESKKILKGKVFSTTENLTKKRVIEMKITRETYSFKKTLGHKMGKFYVLNASFFCF